MPSILWSISGPPKFVPGNLLGGRYIVKDVIKAGRAFQLLNATDSFSHSRPIILRVLKRTRVKEGEVIREIRWLKDSSTNDGRHAQFREDSRDHLYFYLSFEKPRTTLKDIICDPSLKFTRRHVQEITLQIIQLVDDLHDDGLTHGDISPGNIEIISPDRTLDKIYDVDQRTFTYRTVLVSSQIRLLYFGRTGQLNVTNEGTDQYRSPEIVYDMTPRAAGDAFSIGCILFELLKRQPLFPPCQEGPTYRQEKTIVYDAVLGPFPGTLIKDIRASYPGVFKYSNWDVPATDFVLSPVIREFSGTSLPLKYLVQDDDDALNLLEAMLDLDHRRRTSLPDLTDHPFFCRRD